MPNPTTITCLHLNNQPHYNNNYDFSLTMTSGEAVLAGASSLVTSENVLFLRAVVVAVVDSPTVMMLVVPTVMVSVVLDSPTVMVSVILDSPTVMVSVVLNSPIVMVSVVQLFGHICLSLIQSLRLFLSLLNASASAEAFDSMHIGKLMDCSIV